MAPTIEASGLSKRYGKTIALDGLDLLAERGEVVAVLGPNGAGKTTFVRAVATLLRPDAGALRGARARAGGRRRGGGATARAGPGLPPHGCPASPPSSRPPTPP